MLKNVNRISESPDIIINIGTGPALENRKFCAKVNIQPRAVFEHGGEEIGHTNIKEGSPYAQANINIFILIVLNRNCNGNPFMFKPGSYAVQ